MTHYDPRDCGSFGDGVIYIALPTMVLLAMMPRVVRPFLTIIGDTEASDFICAPEAREKRLLGVVLAVSLLVTLWWFAPSNDESLISRLLTPLGQSLAGLLALTAVGAGIAMASSLGQRTMDRCFGKSPASRAGTALMLAGLVVVVSDLRAASLILWFRAFLVVGLLVREYKHVPWRIAKVIGGLGAAFLTVQAARFFINFLAYRL